MPTLPRFRRFAGHNLLGRHLHRLLRRLLDDADEAMMLGLAQRPAFGQLHLVALLGFVLLIVGMNRGAAAEVFAVLGMLGLKVHHHGNRLISLVGGNNADDGTKHRTRGRFGGLSRATRDAIDLMDASGRDPILVETVGVGQDEVDIVRLADITIVILVPGMGDDVQTIKAGIMEIADIFVINKSDREGAERVEREVRAMQSLAMRTDHWSPPIVKTVASEGKGIEELAAVIANYEAYLKKENLVLKRNIQNWRERLVEMLRDAMLERARAQLGDGRAEQYAAEVAQHKRDPYTLVEEIVRKAGQ